MSRTPAANTAGRSALFLDRDGVLNRDIGYPHRIDQIEWLPGVVEAIAVANHAGRMVFVVTNQAGVARGYFEEADVQALHRWMGEALLAQGARIDRFVYCPHHPDGVIDGLSVSCDFRKPRPGMILALLAEFDIDPAQAFLVGDKTSDVEAAQAAGILGLLYEDGDLVALVREGVARTSPPAL